MRGDVSVNGGSQAPVGAIVGPGEDVSVPAAPVAAGCRRGRSPAPGRVTALRLLVVGTFGAIWESVSRLSILDSREFTPFTQVVGEMFRTLVESSTWQAIYQTALGWAVAMVVSTVLGVVLALVIGSNGFLTRSTSLLIDVLRSTPAPALIFVLILLFGSGLLMKVVLVVFAAVFPILVQSMYGLRAIDPVLQDLARTYHLSRRDAFVHIRLPAAMPFIATGVRISSSLALTVTVVAEYLGGAPGLGNLVEEVRAVGDFPRMYALIVLVGFLSVALNFLIRAGESRLLHWHPTYRKAT